MNNGYQPQGAAIPPSPPSGGSDALLGVLKRTVFAMRDGGIFPRDSIFAEMQAAIAKAEGDARRAPDRSPADYAIEHAGYLADAAEVYMLAMQRRCGRDEKRDAAGGLVSAIYEFRKRAALVRP
jgi:hypothetical protein